jgi:PKD repeat protein
MPDSSRPRQRRAVAARIAVAMTFAAAVATAQGSLVAPTGYGVLEGNANNAFPWNRGASSMRIQFVYDSSHFTSQGAPGSILIDRLRYRPDAASTTTSWAGGSWPNVRIDLATCPVDYLAVQSTFASNLGADATTVHQGPVVVQSGSGIGTGTPHPWYIDIPLSAPFFYTPAAGDLVVDIHLDGTGWSGGSRAADHVSSTGNPPPLGSRIYNTTNHLQLTGTVGLNYAAVCEFGWSPAQGLFPAFNATPRTGTSPLTVQFTDASATSDPGGILAWLWDFDNDGTIDSTLQNPSFTFTGCGDFDVKLTVVDAMHGPVSLVKTAYVRTDVVTASFTLAPTGPNSYQFTDTSSPTPQAWQWDFDDDGIVDSTLQNPSHSFGASCSSTIRLTVFYNCRTDSTTRSVLLAPAVLNANLGSGTGTTAAVVGNLFNLNVTAAEGVLVCGLTSATYTGTGPYTASVYITPGGYVGKDTNAAVWRLVATGQGVMGGGSTSAPSLNQIALDRPFYLPAGSYGVAVYHQAQAGNAYIAYDNAQNGPYANADLSIHPSPTTAPGIARTGLFGGSLLTPRQWKGSLHYTKVSLNGQGGYGTFGLGCAGTLGVPHNIAATSPRLGQMLDVDINNLPLDLVLYWWGLSNTTSAAGPLPIDLSVLGAPSCFGRVSLDASVVVTGTSGTARFSFLVPNDPTIVGLQLWAQGLSLDPTANVLGLIATDAAGFIVGQ